MENIAFCRRAAFTGLGPEARTVDEPGPPYAVSSSSRSACEAVLPGSTAARVDDSVALGPGRPYLAWQCGRPQAPDSPPQRPASGPTSPRCTAHGPHLTVSAEDVADAALRVSLSVEPATVAGSAEVPRAYGSHAGQTGRCPP